MKILVSAQRSIDADIPLVDGPGGPAPRFPEYCLNPYCEAALEEASRLAAGTQAQVVAFSLGGPECDQQLRRALALGATTALRLAPTPQADPWQVASLIAGLARQQGADLLLLGASSPCGDSGLVPWLVGRILGWPVAGPAVHPLGEEGLKSRLPGLTVQGRTLRGRAQWDQGLVDFSLGLPAVVCCDLRLNRPSLPLLAAQLGARRATVQVLDPVEVQGRCNSLGAALVLPATAEARPAPPIDIAQLARLLAPLARGPRPASLADPLPPSPESDLPPDAPPNQDLLWLGTSSVGPAELAAVALVQRLAALRGGSYDLLTSDSVMAHRLARFGARRVLHTGGTLPDPSRFPGALDQAVGLLSALPCGRLFVPHGRFGLALVASLATAKGWAALSRVTDGAPGGDLWRLSHSGRVRARVAPLGPGLAATLSPNREEPQVLPSAGPIFALAAPGPALPAQVTWAPAQEPAAPGGPSLDSAPLAIGVGRGVLTSGTLPLVRTLAALLGAPLAGTRLAVDEGALPGDCQVGQSGRTFYGDCYLALGISGSVQHLAGLRTCPTVLALNLDPRAPLRNHCTHFLAAPLETALPALVEELRRLLQDRP